MNRNTNSKHNKTRNKQGRQRRPRRRPTADGRQRTMPTCFTRMSCHQWPVIFPNVSDEHGVCKWGGTPARSRSCRQGPSARICDCKWVGGGGLRHPPPPPPTPPNLVSYARSYAACCRQWPLFPNPIIRATPPLLYDARWLHRTPPPPKLHTGCNPQHLESWEPKTNAGFYSIC